MAMYELSCEMQVPEVVIWIGGLYIYSCSALRVQRIINHGSNWND